MDFTVSDINVVPATQDDLEPLAHMHGRAIDFPDLMRRQNAGLGVLLIARVKGLPVGTVYARWEPPDEPYLQRMLPGTPLLYRLLVHPYCRRRGVATKLLAEAEARIRRRGRGAVALGVALKNFDAIDLYTKRGYAAWRRYPIRTTTTALLADGTTGTVPDRCWIFIKRLRSGS